MTAQLPPEWTEARVREWLLTLTSSGQSDLPLPAGMTVPIAVKSVFEHTPPDRRERLKAGLVLALQEWQHRPHGYPALEALSEIGALIRATAIIPPLAQLVRRECGLRRPDPLRAETLAAATACLQGFAPAADLDMWLRILFYDPDIEPALGGLLFVGLCKGRPDSMSLHAGRFLALRAHVPHGFASIGAALLDAVPPVTLVTQFRELEPEAREVIAHILESVNDSELVFSLDTAGVELSWVQQPRVKVPVYGGSPGVLAERYNKAIAAFTPDNPSIGLLRGLGE